MGDDARVSRLIERYRLGYGEGGPDQQLRAVNRLVTNAVGIVYDEAFSLASVFLGAGARTVYGSLWPVPDSYTSVLMFVLHHHSTPGWIRPARCTRRSSGCSTPIDDRWRACRRRYAEIVPEPVVLLHAWGETSRSFDRLRAALPPHFRAYAFDQRGHGTAPAPDTGYTLDDFADDVISYLDDLRLPHAVLFGSSSGGYVAQQVAARAPARVSGLVLCGSPVDLQGRPAFADEVERLTDPVDPEWVRASLAWFPLFQPVPDRYVDDRVADGARIPAHVWRQTFTGLWTAVPPTRAGAITAPALVIRGDRDELISRKDQEALAAAIPGSRLVVYDDTGHLVLWEQPDRLAADLAAFTDQVSPL